jgi:hypothetical protein
MRQKAKRARNTPYFNPFREDRQRRIQELISVIERQGKVDLEWLLGWGGLRWGSTEEAIMRMLNQLDKARIVELNLNEHTVSYIALGPSEKEATPVLSGNVKNKSKKLKPRRRSDVTQIDIETVVNIASRDIFNRWGRVFLKDLKRDYNLDDADINNLISGLLQSGYAIQMPQPDLLLIRISRSTPNKWAKERRRIAAFQEEIPLEEDSG